MSDVMLDLETLGTRPGSVILSIGAVEFDPRGNGTGRTFYRNIDPESCKAVGLKVDPATVQWWTEQSQAARDAINANKIHIVNAVLDFGAWFVAIGAERVWANGSHFDCQIWAEATFASGDVVPWKYNAPRDMKTWCEALGFEHRMFKRTGVEHDALADATHQALTVQASSDAARQ